MGDMGRVVDLRAWQEGRDGRAAGPAPLDAVWRLEAAVKRLDRLVDRLSAGMHPIEPQVETEVLAITGAVTVGLTEEAAERAERLAELLEGSVAGGG